MSAAAPLAGDRIPTLSHAGWRTGDAAARRAFADALGSAAGTCGFARLVDHAIDPSVRDAAFEAGRRFFALPEDVRLAVRDRGSDRGYHPMYDNLREDGKPSGQEGYTMGHPERPRDATLELLSFYAPTPWPALPGFREPLEALYASLFRVGRDLFDAFAMHLAAPAGVFDSALVDTYSHLRINHYPPQEAIAHVAEDGIFPHYDESLMTLLIQDRNSGLQVMGRDGLWIPVDPDPDAIVVNVGKMLRHWTGGRYHAALHQVINASGRDRYSIPLFVHPSWRTRVDPAALTGRSHPDFPPIVAGETVRASFATSRQSWKDAEAASS